MMKTKFRTLVSAFRNGNVSFPFLKNLPLERLGAFCVFFVLLFSTSLQAQETLHGDNFFVSKGAQVHCVTINSAGEQSKITITEENQAYYWQKQNADSEALSKQKSKSNNFEKKVTKKPLEKKYLTKKNHPSDKKLINALNPDAQNFWGDSKGSVREISVPQVFQIALLSSSVYYAKPITKNLFLDPAYTFTYYGRLYSFSGFSRPPPSFLA